MFSGCANREMALTNALMNGAMQTSGTAAKVGNSTVANMLKSPQAMKGLGQSQVIGARMMMNPAVLGVGALGTAISKRNEAKNRAAFGNVAELAVHSDRVNNSMQHMLVKAYNQKHGTHYRTFNELQDHAKIKGYNEQEGTHFTTFTEVRNDYNRKNGTHFQTDRALREYIAANR